MTALAIDIGAIDEARARLARRVVRTPLLNNPALDAQAVGRVFVKAENLQRTGSFKFRGAMNKLLSLSKAELARGVIAFSSGNHALAVAEAAKLLGCAAAIVMPADAPEIKLAGVRRRGAEVILYDRMSGDREAIAASVMAERGLTLVPPFDDPLIMAGQGSGAAEAVEQIRDEFGVARVDQALICCSGGGLAAGWSTALRAAYPCVEIVVVEPAGFDDTARSLESGAWMVNARASGTICDALQLMTPGRLTLPILMHHKARGVSITDDEALQAMRFAVLELKLVLEPGGAAALAVALAGKVETKDRTTLLVASGGNVDPAMLIRAFDAQA